MCNSSGRELALQVQGPELNPQYAKKIKLDSSIIQFILFHHRTRISHSFHFTSLLSKSPIPLTWFLTL
jgi:hypothetical protein